MKTLVYLQNNTFESIQTLEYIVDLAQFLKVELKIIHIQFPDTVIAHFDSRNQLFTPPHLYASKKQEFISQTTKNSRLLLEKGKIKKNIPFEYYSGMPSDILSYLYSIDYFDMLLLENESAKVSTFPYQSIKEIIRTIKCPIWVIPENLTFSPLKEFSYMTDYQEEDALAIKFIFDRFQDSISTIKITHFSIHNSFEEEIERLGFETILKEMYDEVDFKSILYIQDKEENLSLTIRNWVEKEIPGVIVSLKDNKKFMQRVFYKSFINALLSQDKAPVLILHRENFIQDSI
ncbi:MAG: hypothetical protein RR202_02990 [Bacteroidales bacterium]